MTFWQCASGYLQQAGTADTRRDILDKAMDGRIELLQQQVEKLKQENGQLQKRICRAG